MLNQFKNNSQITNKLALKLKVKVGVYVRFAAIQKHQAPDQIFQSPEFILPTSVLGIEPGTSEWFVKALSAMETLSYRTIKEISITEY